MTADKIERTDAELPIVFIVAHGRSGSTLLQTILDAHPNTSAPVESRFVVHFKQKYGKITEWTPERKQAFLRDLFTEIKIELFWELDGEQLKQRLMDLPINSNYGAICKAVYLSSKSVFPKTQRTVIIDKNPIYALLIPNLLEVFPNARFIHLVRDYRACASSVLSILPKANVYTLGQRWLLSNVEIERVKHVCPEQFHTVRYADFITDPEDQVRALTAFIGIAFDPDMLRYYEHTATAIRDYIDRAPTERIRKYRTLGTGTVHQNISRKIQPTYLDKWKEKLSEEQQVTLNASCEGFAQRYAGGATEPTQLSMGSRFFRAKIRLYYLLPIWLRELKSKPSLGLLEGNGR